MLVLSRRVEDSIVFPDLGISIEILHLKGKSVRVGVDAPIEVKVLRGELETANRVCSRKFDLKGETEHEVRNKLNTLNIATGFARKLIERGEYNLAANKLYEALSDIEGVAIEGKQAESKIGSTNDDSLSALLVEDVENEREMLAGFLRLHGVQVATAPDGESAINYLESNTKPDFMMVDIGLPGISGADLILDVRSNPAFDGVKLFAISGQSPQQANINMSENRIAKWFQKPLRPNHLILEIEQTVRDDGQPSQPAVF